MTKNAKRTSNMQNFLSGGIAGAISRIMTAPLERLKILYQVNYKGYSNPPNMARGLREIVINDGFTGLFRGNFVNLLKATPKTSIKFAVFEFLKHLFKNGDSTATLSNSRIFLCGGIAGIISSFCVFPLDVLKTRFAAVPTGTYQSIFDAIRKISKTEGRLKPFFNGFQATLCSALPKTGLNLMTYEFLRGSATKYFEKKNRDVPLTLFMGIGAFSAMVASSFMYPGQLVTSRMIMQGVNEKPKRMMDVIREVKINEGFAGFFKGLKPAISKVLFGNGIVFGAYEVCKNHLKLC